ncbi:MAG: hypothetical protein F4103_09190 [Boseongicola sp. SB0673_bin_14]|nr:hypothetical protein [Boseongicola sp. SB0673_bin_14]
MTPRRFIDVLNWSALVAPGVMSCKDGSFLAGWELAGIDSESLEPDALASRLQHLGFALSGLLDGDAVWVVFDRRPWVPDSEPANTGQVAVDLVAQESHALLAEPGTTWRDRLLLFHGWRPETPGRLEDGLAGFNEARQRQESLFGTMVGLSRLVPAGPGAPCPFCGALTGLLGQSRTAPRFGEGDLPVGLDMLLGADVLQTRRAGPVSLDGRALAILALEGLPVSYGLSPFERFQDIPCSFTWVTRYEGVSPRTARPTVRRRQRLWRQGSADLVANIGGESAGNRDLYGDTMAESLEAVAARMSRGVEGHGYYVSLFLVQGASRKAIAPSLALLQAAADDGHYGLREERFNAIPALLSALPGHSAGNARRAMLRAQGMADLMPVRSIWRGSPTCPSPRLPAGTPALLEARTRTGEHFNLNLHERDVGHTLLFGPTGSGKSVLLGRIVAAWLRYPDAQVIFFDRQRSIAHACAALGGTFLEPGIPGSSGIAPFAHIGRLGASWGLSWLSALVELGLERRPTPEEAAELRRAVESLEGIARPKLRNAWEFVQSRPLRQVLDAGFEGPDAGVFDADDADLGAVLQAAPLTVFETHTLFGASQAVKMLSVDYIFAETDLRFDGRPTLVVLDEAWSFFTHPLWIERIRSWLKEGRKRNVSVLMATQSVADASRRTDLTADLLESCPTRLYLANPEAGTLEMRPHYEALSLGPAQIELISRITPKRELYLVQTEGGKRVISLPMGPAALSILGRTGSEDSARALRLGPENPDFWKEDLENDVGFDLLRPPEAA